MSEESKRLTDTITGGTGQVLPHYRTFTALWNTASRVYSARWDEARRNSDEHARAMLRDCYFRALLQERILPLARHKWEICADPDDIPKRGKDPYSEDRERVRQLIEACCRRTPELVHARAYLGQSIWYGRYGMQVSYGRAEVAGYSMQVPIASDPVMGDKIHFTWDGEPGVMVNPMFRDTPGWDVRTFDNFGPVLILNRKDLRQRFVIQKHQVEDADFMDTQSAGRRHGVGLRDFVYWAWWLRQELVSWVVDFMEKVGSMGIVVVPYKSGNAESKKAAEATAIGIRNTNAIAVPVEQGKDTGLWEPKLIPPNTSGAQYLSDLVANYSEKHIERLIVGQSMSGGSDASDGLGGTGRANLANETKFALISHDAECQAAGYTSDLVKPIQELNFPKLKWRYEWKYVLDDPNADKKIKNAQTIVGMGGTVIKQELYSSAGLTVPNEDDDVIGGQMGMNDQNTGGDPAYPAAGDQTRAGMSELVAAMVDAGAKGDTSAVNALARLGSNPDRFGRFLDSQGIGNDDDQGAAKPHADETPKSYRWSQDTSQTGTVKAVWQGPGQRKPLYGAEAEAALRGQDKFGDGEFDRARTSGPSGGARVMQQFKQSAQPHRERGKQVFEEAVKNPGSVQPQDLPQLADHINTMTAAELKGVSRDLRLRVGGLKEDLVRRLLEHVGGGIGESATAARGAGFNFDVSTGQALDKAIKPAGQTAVKPQNQTEPSVQPPAEIPAPRDESDDTPVGMDSTQIEPNVAGKPSKPIPPEPATTKPEPASPAPSSSAMPDWYPEYRELQNRSDMGGKLSPDESAKLKDLTGKLMGQASAEMSQGAAKPQKKHPAKVEPVKESKPKTPKKPVQPSKPKPERKTYTGPTEMAKKRWQENAEVVEKYIATQKKKLEKLEQQESLAKWILNNHGKIKFDSAMEASFGSIKDAVEHGIPRWLITNDPKASSLDQIAQAMQSQGAAGGQDLIGGRAGEKQHPTDWLLEQLSRGVTQDFDTSGEREKIAEELHFLEKARGTDVRTDNYLAGEIRNARKLARRKIRTPASEELQGGFGENDYPPESEHDPEYDGDKLDWERLSAESEQYLNYVDKPRAEYSAEYGQLNLKKKRSPEEEAKWAAMRALMDHHPYYE